MFLVFIVIFCAFFSSIFISSRNPGWGQTPGFLPHWLPCPHKVKAKFILRPTVSRPFHLSVKHPSGTRDQLFSLKFFRQLRVSFVAPSLTRGRVCNLLLLLVLASAVPLGSEFSGTQDHILLSQFLRLPQPVDNQLPTYIYWVIVHYHPIYQRMDTLKRVHAHYI
jgi:hypothetical protein